MGIISSYCPNCGGGIGWFITAPKECKHCQYKVTEDELWNTFILFQEINDRRPSKEEVLCTIRKDYSFLFPNMLEANELFKDLCCPDMLSSNPMICDCEKPNEK